MNKTSVAQYAKATSSLQPAQSLIQRKCACGNHTVAGEECPECAKKKIGLQRKLAIGASNDPLEQEADRVADQVISAPSSSGISGAPLHIQRYAGQATRQMDTAPASVNLVLAGSGRPLEPALRENMEQHFGHDFSQVQVHFGGVAEQSARDLNANAYTVGQNIVFGAGRFVPGTHEGRRLLAHELTHVVQQSGADGMRVNQSNEKRGLPSPSLPLVQRAPDDKGGTSMKSEATDTPYAEEQEVLLYASKALDENKLREGTVFYAEKYWKATGISASAFAVGPFGSDMGQLFYVYRLKSSAEKGSARTFTRGTYLGGWRSGKITPEVQNELASVTGTKELQVKSPGVTFREPRDSLTFMMVVWQARGLLDPAHMPQDVGAIPPLRVTQAEEKQLRANLSGPAGAALFGGITLVGQTGRAAQTVMSGTGTDIAATTFARGTGTFEIVTEEAAAAAEQAGAATVKGETTTAIGRAVGTRAAGATAAGVTVGVSILIYESPNPVSNYDTGMSEVTGGPYGTPGEYEWENRLTPRQRRYIRDLWNQRYTAPAPVPIQAPEPQPTQKTKPAPEQTKTTEPVPTPTTETEPEQERRRRRRRCNAPTGLTPDDPIPISWFKPKVDDWYPPQIELQGHTYSRDAQAQLPHGEPIGVSSRFWPTPSKLVQLAPDCGVPRNGRICPNASRFRDVLTGYGFQWGGRRYLQADHVQDVQWAAPDGTHLDDFRNLWPMDSSANNSAGSLQNLHQPVTFCEMPRGPLVEQRIGEVMRLARAGRPYYGRYFVINTISRGP